MATQLEEAPTKPVARKRRRWGLIALLVLVVLPLTVFALYTWAALTFVYSSGERAGYVQKFSQKGWACKTWEGELAMVNVPGAMQEKFNFTVRDDSVASLISAAAGKHVVLQYAQHRGIPISCFGDTEYFVTGLRVE
jgi:nicotinamide riboside transporter PnuC